MNNKVNILVFDNSIAYRQLLSSVVDKIVEAECVGTAASSEIALRKISNLQPDLLLLSIAMLDAKAIASLQQFKQVQPRLEIIIYSALNMDEIKQTLSSLQLTVLAFFTKPSHTNTAQEMSDWLNYLQPFIHLIQTRKYAQHGYKKTVSTNTPLPSHAQKTIKQARFNLCVIGISTGGPEALDTLIPQLGDHLPCPIIIVQHMPASFTESLAIKLNTVTHLQVSEAKDGERLQTGHIYIAQGGKHLLIKAVQDGSFCLAIDDAPPVNNCKPAVDVLFCSVAETFKGKVLAIVMTGMGRDGTEGVRALKHKGAYCLVQDEATSVIWGMPKSVYEAGLADEIVPLAQLSSRIAALVLSL